MTLCINQISQHNDVQIFSTTDNFSTRFSDDFPHFLKILYDKCIYLMCVHFFISGEYIKFDAMGKFVMPERLHTANIVDNKGLHLQF